MPNHITNVIELNCSERTMRKIGNFLRGSKNAYFGKVDFNRLIPMPERLNIESSSKGDKGALAYMDFISKAEALSAREKRAFEAACIMKLGEDPSVWELGRKYYENIRDYGAPNWYSWCIEHWDTKWNAYECIKAEPENRRLMFLTAWSCVMPIVEAISAKFPDMEIFYGWADENCGYNVGIVRLKNGNVLERNIPEEGSEEAYRMADEIYCIDISSDPVLSKHGNYCG